MAEFDNDIEYEEDIIDDTPEELSHYNDEDTIVAPFVHDDDDDNNYEEIESQDDNEGTVEAQDDELDYWEYPEFIPDDFVAPEEFKSPKAELAWYKEKYLDLMDHYRSDEFVERLKENHAQILLGNAEKVQQFKAFDAMATGNPELAVKLYAPQLLAQQGKDYKPTDEEVYDYLDKQLAREFGKNYKNVYDPDDANDPDTISGKMFLRQQYLQQTIEQRMQENEEVVQEYIPVDPQVILDEQYELLSGSMDREEYDEFIEHCKNELSEKPLDVQDLYLLFHIDDIAEEIYNNGIQEGMKRTGQTFKTYGKQVSTYNEDVVPQKPFEPNTNVYNQLRSN